MNLLSSAPAAGKPDERQSGTPSSPGRPAIFVDRDGTIMEDTGYPRSPEEVRLLPYVCEALGALQQRGYAVVVVSNQSGVGRGLISLEEAQSVHRRLEEHLNAGGLHLDGTFYCYDSPAAATEFRKPGIGMLLDAQRRLSLRFRGSFMIGDKSSDVEAGKEAGCRTILLRTDGNLTHRGAHAADYVASSWSEILQIVSKYDSE